MGYLWTGKIVLGLGLKGLSSFDITAGNEGEPSDALTDFKLSTLTDSVSIVSVRDSALSTE